MGAFKQFLKSIADYAAAGFPNVPEAEFKHRIQTCGACERFKLGMCLECKCFIGLKARMETEDCPLKKWTGTN